MGQIFILINSLKTKTYIFIWLYSLDANDIKQFNEKYDPNVFLNGNKGSKNLTTRQFN